MSRVDELCFKSREMELEEDFYSYDFDSEGLPNCQDHNELIAALRQKEEDVILAAQLGNALLLENRQLKEERSKLHEQYADKIEVLEQDRHVLQLKLQDHQAQWESQEGELQRDVRELSAQVESLKKALAEAEREKSCREQQYVEQCLELQEQLNDAMAAERAATADVQSLQTELRKREDSGPQHEELLSALKEQVARLTEQERDLSQRFVAMCEENAALRDSMSLLHTRLALQEQQSHTQMQQLVESQQEVKEARSRVQIFQSQIEELCEEASLQQGSHRDSLLSEMECSLDTLGWSQDKEQATQEVSSILDMLLPVSHGLDVSPVQDDNLQSLLVHLRSVAERIVQNQTVQNTRLAEENSRLRLNAGCRLDEETVQRAIKDRDDAIAKKTAVEAELLQTKNDMMCLNNQLLEAVQCKLQLSQELEAWQDDIQIIINQQLRSQHQMEQQPQTERKRSGRLSLLYKTQKTSNTRMPNPNPPQVGSHWRDWLKLGK